MEKADLERLLADAVTADASTLRLAAGHCPSMRVKGRLVKTSAATATAAELDELSREFLFEDHRQRLDQGHEVEFLYTSSGNVRFRSVVSCQSEGLGLAFHRIPTQVQTFEELNLPAVLSGLASLHSGLVVITGFMGSGKTTTVAAMTDYINQGQSRHIVTIENPIEYIHQPVRACIQQREVGFHTQSFAGGVAEARRVGADVIVVSDVPDRQTLEAILEATEQGALVITTIRASSVAAGLVELLNHFAGDKRDSARIRLAMAMRATIAQTLLNQSEDRGKVPLLEILVNSPAVARIIREGKLEDLHDTMLRGRGLGTQTLDAGLRDLINRSLITNDEAMIHAVDLESV